MPRHTIALWLLLTVTMITSLIVAGDAEAAAAKLADGTYEVDYTVKKPDDESVSIANDYFEKPARVEVTGGEAAIYFQTNHNKWIASLKYPAGDGGSELEVIETDEAEDTKVVRLPHSNPFEPALLSVHVKIDELGYDSVYTVRLVFAADRLPLLSESEPAPAVETETSEADQAEAEDKPDVPKPEQQASEQIQQDQQTAEPVQQESDSALPDAGESEGEEPAGSAGAPEPEPSIAPEATGGNPPQAAGQEITGSPEDKRPVRTIWLIALPIVLAGCVLAAIGLVHRSRSKRRQVH